MTRLVTFQRPNRIFVAINPAYVRVVEPSTNGATIVLTNGSIIVVSSTFEDTVKHLSSDEDVSPDTDSVEDPPSDPVRAAVKNR